MSVRTGFEMPPAVASVVIEPRRGWAAANVRDLWAHHELLYFLVWRDVRVRYKQTVLGAAWAVIQPFMTMVIFSIVFGRLAGVPSDGLPYPIFAFCGLLPWQLFAHALGHAANSLVASQSLITKVYFPRLLIPMAAVLGGLVDFGIGFVFLVGMMLYYGVVPSAAVATLPLFLMLALLTALALGVWFSALSVRYRDLRHTVPFLIQFWLFATPVAYPSSLIPEPWRLLYGLNPMLAVVEGFRWALVGAPRAPWNLFAVGTIVMTVVLVAGLYYFRRTERTFADVI